MLVFIKTYFATIYRKQFFFAQISNLLLLKKMNNITFEYIIITFQAISKSSMSDPQVLVLKMIFYPLNIILAQSFIVFFFFQIEAYQKLKVFVKTVNDLCYNQKLWCLSKIIVIELHQDESSVGFEVNSKSNSNGNFFYHYSFKKLMNSKLTIIKFVMWFWNNRKHGHFFKN